MVAMTTALYNRNMVMHYITYSAADKIIYRSLELCNAQA